MVYSVPVPANNTPWKFESGDVYKGEWENGRPHGNGNMKYQNGEEYDGSWLNGMRHGKGIMMDNEGMEYSGEWVNDQKHGKGIEMEQQEGSQCWDGEWKEGLFVSGKLIEEYHNYTCENWCGEDREINGKCIIQLNEWVLEYQKDGLIDDETVEDLKTECGTRYYVRGKDVTETNAAQMNALTNDCCAICMEDIYDQLCVTKCGHMFHTTCMLQCFQRKNECPLCRAKLIE